MCLDYDFNFRAMYAAVGLWNAFFLAIYSLFGFSRLMKWCTRSTEEVFALFIVVAFITDASKDLIKSECSIQVGHDTVRAKINQEQIFTGTTLARLVVEAS